MISFSGTFKLPGKLSGRTQRKHFQLCKNMCEFRLNNPKVLKLAAVNATSKAFRF
ncbi:hypothetical protein [Halopseudomonas pelagia]|uniref:hypothetical protein n=1 Tax=Halopseudomonas pelagia TaxID=553151 RepID=UPI0012934B6A|nr:hypothetical protein [Halopseudomonas pelagia]